MLPLQAGVRYLVHIERTPTDVGLDVRQGRRTAYPADLALLLHLMQHGDQIALLALLHARIVQLHYVHIVGLHPLQALMQAAEQVLSRPYVGRFVGITLLVDHMTATFRRQIVLRAPAAQVLADELLAPAVIVRGIDEVDSGVQDRVQNRLRLLVGDGATAPDARTTYLHCAIAKRSHFEAGAAQRALSVHSFCFSFVG